MSTTETAVQTDDPDVIADYVQVVGPSMSLLRGDLPVYLDGFRWTAVIERPHLAAREQDEATAVTDGTIVARGHVDAVEATDEAQLLHVTPP